MNPLENIILVLYQPQDIVNVGGVVRVMSNFGLKRLRLVEPAAFDPVRIEGIAHHTEKLAAGIERFPSLEEALKDCGFVLGTTARKRGIRREYLTPRQVGPYLLKTSQKGMETPSALLFGREDNGLPNEALDLCHALVTIPTDETNRSLNLAQAALVLAYELWVATHPADTAGEEIGTNLSGEGLEEPVMEQPLVPQSLARPPGAPPRRRETPSTLESLEAALAEDQRLASGLDREVMFAALADVLRSLHPDTTELRMVYSMARLRAMLLRAAPRSDESRLLAHLFQHIARKVRPKNED